MILATTSTAALMIALMDLTVLAMRRIPSAVKAYEETYAQIKLMREQNREPTPQEFATINARIEKARERLHAE